MNVPSPSRSSKLATLLPLGLALLAAAPASAQISYLTRNGADLVGAGPLAGGQTILHRFLTPTSTPLETLTLNDPGPPQTHAVVSFEAIASPSSLTLRQSGVATRGASTFPYVALADARDDWQFMLAADACFTLTVSHSLSSTSAADVSSSVLFASQFPITLADGTSTSGFSHSIANGNGAFSTALAGVLHPGRYSVNIAGRVNAPPEAFQGSFAGEFVLTLSPAPCAPACDPDLNQDGNVDQGDLDYLIDVIAGGPNPTSADPDFNHDGNIDQDDINALVNVISGGACP